jgi:beta-lactamase regulating signal transducer with metallopeptidase domain
MITIQNLIGNWFTPELMSAIGWTIIHSLWQGALVAVLLAIVLAALRNNASTNRYAVSVTAMFAMLQISLFTFFAIYEPRSLADDLTSPTTIIGSEVLVNQVYDIHNLNQNSEVLATAQEQNSLVSYYNATIENIKNNLHLIVATWIIGVVLFSLRFAGSLLYINKLKNKYVGAAPESWLKLSADISHKLRLRKNVKVLLSDLVHTPTAIGIFKPVILMPISLQTGLSMAEVESILAHELAHIRRNDYLINIFQSVAEILFFYHPAIWWISANIREERENCCDDMAVAAIGDSMVYSRTLARMNEMAHQQTYNQTALAFAGRKGSLLGRIKRLFSQRNENNVFAERFAAATIIVAGMLVSLTANAGLLTDKAATVIRQVSNTLPEIVAAPFEKEVVLADTTKSKKPKLIITVDENGKADTIKVGEGKSKMYFGSFDLEDGNFVFVPPVPPVPPTAPLAPLAPIPDIPDMPDVPDFSDDDFNFSFESEDEQNKGKTKKISVQMFSTDNKKTVVVNGKNISLDSMGGKNVEVLRENGRVKLLINGKETTIIDLGKLSKDARIYGSNFVFNTDNFRNKSYNSFYFNNSQSSKSFDSLKNTKEYKKKREKYEKALAEYEQMMLKYKQEMRKNGKENVKDGANAAPFRDSEEWRAYEEALRDYEEAVQENHREVANLDRERQEMIREQQHIAREQQRIAREEKRIVMEEQRHKEIEKRHLEIEKRHKQIEAANEIKMAKVKEELKKDGFAIDKIKIEVNSKRMIINGKEVSAELAEKYRKILDLRDTADGDFTFEQTQD